MKERPLLFSGPMVRALLEGRKTQTRRIVKPQPLYEGLEVTRISPLLEGADCHKTGEFMIHHPEYDRVVRSGLWCSYGRPGDRLWVREMFWKVPEPSLRQLRDGADTWPKCAYDADESDVSREQNRDMGWERKPSIHMPRWASRITLEITEVRVQRIQNISEQDAEAEGVDFISDAPAATNHRTSFARLWDKINADRAPWASNPWVWAVSFRAPAAQRLAQEGLPLTPSAGVCP